MDVASLVTKRVVSVIVAMREGTVINRDSFKAYHKLKASFEVDMEKYVPSDDNN